MPNSHQRCRNRHRLACWRAIALWIVAVVCCSRARVLQQRRAEDMQDSAAACVTLSNATDIYNLVSALKAGAEQSICISAEAPECVTAPQSDIRIQHARERRTLRALCTSLTHAPPSNEHAAQTAGCSSYAALPRSREFG